jgi:EAL domain-containing protein (putative c-di-GMP-specific phosphodiesterase class I)
LPQAVAEALEKHQLDPRWLEIELTESLLLTDSHRAKAAIDQLADLGVGLALDDFGTGYASFSYLQRFQFHRLKIDRSLVQHVAERPRDAAIVGAIAGMGRALNMQILAEGIETPEQARALRASGCGVAQGYLYARPLPAAEAGRWINHHASNKD